MNSLSSTYQQSDLSSKLETRLFSPYELFKLRSYFSFFLPNLSPILPVLPIQASFLRLLIQKYSFHHLRQATPLQLFQHLSLIHISEPTRLGMISYAVFCLKKKNDKENTT